MHRQVFRMVMLMFLLFFLVSDLVELLSYLPGTTPVLLAPLIQRLAAAKPAHPSAKNKLIEDPRLVQKESDVELSFQNNGAERTRSSTLRSSIGNQQFRSQGHPGIASFRKSTGSSVSVPIADSDLTEEEQDQLTTLRSEWTKVMQQYCLPKLVCELHASLSDGSVLSDAEKGLLSLIKETSLGSAGEVVSRYHFAAHMGQLLSGVEGNGCHNFYPSCPISGTRVLQMVKKVRIK